MQRLTVAGRLLITALIIGAIYFGFKMLGGKEALETLKTATGRSIGDARAAQMRGYLEVLRQEIHGI